VYFLSLYLSQIPKALHRSNRPLPEGQAGIAWKRSDLLNFQPPL